MSRQGSLIVEEYIEKFNNMSVWCHTVEDDHEVLFRFKMGLWQKILRGMAHLWLYTVK